MMKMLALARRFSALNALPLALAACCVGAPLALAPPACAAEVTAPASLPLVSPLFTDNMVLQRGRPVVVWGWTEPGKAVTVTIAGKSAVGMADAQGKWTAKLPALPVGGPYQMTVSVPQNTPGSAARAESRTRGQAFAKPQGPYPAGDPGPRAITLQNILVGDVWICSGQSNMEFGLGNVVNAAQEIASADYPQIRLYTVKREVATTPRLIPSGKWDVCTPQTVPVGGWNGFSAVGYYFGRELYRNLKVPIGLIHTSWGGTPAEAWTSAEGLEALPDYRPQLAQLVQMQQEAKNAASDPNAKPVALPKSDYPNFPTVLYNGMIAPLLPYGIKGAIWYQGESNAGKAYQYRSLLPAMIEDWRAGWHEGNFPFYIVQLANFQQSKPNPTEDAWAELREAQSLTAAHLPNTGLAVTIDIGDANDIHPKNKQEVGRRLALAALAQTYGKRIEYSGPQYKSMKIEDGKIRLTFSHIGGGLTAKGGDKLTGFVVAGDDHKFAWADARIEGNTVVVSSPQVAKPVAVRYAWAINPVCNLYNQAGLPASPFRTDDWPGITVNNK